VRDEAGEAEDVLVVSPLAAPRRGRRRRGRHARLASAEPDARELPATRATVVRAEALADEGEGKDWLAAITRDPEARDAFVAEALGILNTALHAQRAAAMDPFVSELGAHRAVATRVGYGAGEEVAAGRWTKAVDAPPEPSRRQRRAEALRPQERLAAILAGRDRVAACETLTLRARLDLDHGRPLEAALEIEAAARAMPAELAGASASAEQEEDLAAIRDRSAALYALRGEALAGELSERGRETLEETLAICERVLRRRRILE
jgi:hypothetical protein